LTGLRTRLTRWNRSQAELEAEELLDELTYAEIARIADCAAGDKPRVSGTVRSLTIRPRTAIPALEIELYDGSGSLRVLWLGRRRIDGIAPGRKMIIHGRITTSDRHLTVFNPRYLLLPATHS
jgi:RecG-like helicase